MPAIVVAGAIAAAGSVGAAAIESHGASSAANAQIQAGNRAAQVEQQIYSDQVARMQPFVNAGTGATGLLSSLMNPNSGPPGQGPMNPNGAPSGGAPNNSVGNNFNYTGGSLLTPWTVPFDPHQTNGMGIGAPNLLAKPSAGGAPPFPVMPNGGAPTGPMASTAGPGGPMPGANTMAMPMSVVAAMGAPAGPAGMPPGGGGVPGGAAGAPGGVPGMVGGGPAGSPMAPTGPGGAPPPATVITLRNTDGNIITVPAPMAPGYMSRGAQIVRVGG